jgi:hypothetical protein
VDGLRTVGLLIDFQYKKRLSPASGLSGSGSAAHPSEGDAVQRRSGLVSDQICATLINILNKRSDDTTQMYLLWRVQKHGNKLSIIYSAAEYRTYLYLNHPVVFLRLLFPVNRWPAEWSLKISCHFPHTNRAELGYNAMRGTEYFCMFIKECFYNRGVEFYH